MNYKNAREKYKKIVQENLLSGLYELDPDQSFIDIIQINGNLEKIKMASDGVCGYKQIKRIYNNIEKQKEVYLIIREDMFDFLIWPSQKVSINQQRYGYFRDRLDETLIDIQKFYEIIEENNIKEINLKNIEQIKKYFILKNCKMYNAYLQENTFKWLNSFKNFNDFIIKRNLEVFVKKENNNYKAELWTSKKEVSKEYFEVLLEKIKKYKNILSSGV